MRILLLVRSPGDAATARAAVAFANAVHQSEHALEGVFFHSEGVTHAVESAGPSDEWSAIKAWRALPNQKLSLCSTSWERRGGENAPAGFELGSLGQLADQIHEVDRVVTL